MLTQLSHVGFYFSPLTLYYLYDQVRDGSERLAAVVAEVNNTPWGEQHNYVLKNSAADRLPAESSDGLLSREAPPASGVGTAVLDRPHVVAPTSQPLRSFEHTKDFHVSPFMTSDRRYAWRWTPPGERLAVRIASVPKDGGEAGNPFTFDATMSLRRRAWTRGAHLRLLASRPLTPLWILGAIYWEAVRLWWKGAGFVPHPQRS